MDQLREVTEQVGRPVTDLEDLLELLLRRNAQVIKVFEGRVVDWVREVGMTFPLNLWIPDDRSAVLSVPALEKGGLEFGFETRDSNMVRALRSMWQFYSCEGEVTAMSWLEGKLTWHDEVHHTSNP